MAQHHPPPNWERWHNQYTQGPAYTHLDPPPGMVHYTTSIRQATQQQYPMATTYGMNTLPSMAPSNPYAVQAYDTPASPTPLVSHRPYHEQRPIYGDRAQDITYSRTPQFTYRGDQTRSPASKHETQVPQEQQPKQDSSCREPDQATTESPSKKFENHTPVDEMMKIIQDRGSDEEEEEEEEEEGDEEEEEDDADDDDDTVVGENLKGEEEDDEQSEFGYQTPPSSENDSRPSTPRSKGCSKRSDRITKKKPIKCGWKGCKKTFGQTTHHKVHMRKHTGEKPYRCDWTDENGVRCPHTFTQSGNRKTHYRRHTGERPYVCHCGKGFAQRGNLKAHLDTHNPDKRFRCHLDDCVKTFSQRGNLKSHQNKFHKETLAGMTMKFSGISSVDDLEDEKDREMYKHFKDVYRNMNKGIKGRGKGRTIKKSIVKTVSRTETHLYPVQQRTPPMEHAMPAPYQSLGSYPQQHGLPQLQTSWPNYSLPREGHYSMMMERVHTRGYEIYSVDQDSMSNSSTSATISTPATSIYEEDHARSLAFRDRMY